MKFGLIELVNGAQIKKMRTELVAADPSGVELFDGRMWYNTTDKAYRGYQDGAIITFASGGNTQVLQSEIDKIEESVGLAADGAFPSMTGSNYLGGVATVVGGLAALDTQVKSVADSVASAVSTGLDPLKTEVDAIEAAVGLGADGTLAALTGNYIAGATSVVAAVVAVDAATKAAADAIAQEAIDRDAAILVETNARTQAVADEASARALAITAEETARTQADALKLDLAGGTMGGNIAMAGNAITGVAAPQNAGDAANKNYVDSVISGVASWKTAVTAITDDKAALAATLVAGDIVVDTTDNKTYKYDGAAFDAGVALKDGDAFFDKTDETGYVFSGSEIVQFTGGGQMTAGIGLKKTGNVLDVNLGAGIGQLPTDEVGVDVYATGGLFLTADGVTASTDTAAQLSLKLDGASLYVGASGLKIAQQGVGAAEIASAALGLGLAGGNGVAVAVKANTGVVVDENGVGLDLVFADARFAAKAATETALSTNADAIAQEVTDRTAAIAQEVTDRNAAILVETDARTDADTALATRLSSSFFVYEAQAAAVEHTIVHNFGTKYVNVTVYDAAGKQMLPDDVEAVDANTVKVTLPASALCAVAVSGLKSA